MGWKFAISATILHAFVLTTLKSELAPIISVIRLFTGITRRVEKPTASTVTSMMRKILIGKSANVLVLKHVIARNVIKGGDKNVANVGERKRQNSPKNQITAEKVTTSMFMGKSGT